jgi:HEAT repeat protein
MRPMNAPVVRGVQAAALLALSLAIGPSADAADPARDIKDRDFQVRLAAIEEIEASGGPESEALLVDALNDRDWQVIERAAVALAKKGGRTAVNDLVRVAAEGPIRRIRITAARSAGKIDEKRALEALGRKLTGEHVVHALEAVGAIVQTTQNEDAAKVIDDGLKVSQNHEMESPSGGKERDPVRRAAATSLTVFPVPERVELVRKLMFDKDIGVGCAALDTVIAVPDPAFAGVLLEGLTQAKIDDCVERRLRNGLRAIVAAAPAEQAAKVAEPILFAASTATAPEAAARLARLVGDLGKAPPKIDAELEPVRAEKFKDAKPVVPADTALTTLKSAIAHADSSVRAAAAGALAKIRVEGCVAPLVELGSKDADARVRTTAVRGLAATITAKDSRAFNVFQAGLSDADAMVREECAVALGVKGVRGAVPSLTKLVDDAMAEKPSRDKKKPAMKWAAGTVALISMGLTQDQAALEPLRATLKDSSDWRLRASAVVGLGRLQKNAAVADLIGALDDKDVSVHNCAYEFLRRLTSKDIPRDSKAWRDWWKESEANYVFVDRDAEHRKAKKYGYAPTITGLYQGLDIVALVSRKGGDQIESMLEEMKISHRTCRSPQVNEVGLHPFALFVANCTGEIQERDVESLAWFVRAGGYLFSSCWALDKTVLRIYPSTIQRFQTRGAQVIDANVPAAPCVPDSPYIEGAFDEWTQPMYVLEGAYLIEVLDPERVEVLVDSPATATSWGVGNLACWFNAGHGVVFDSVNHFSHQGFHSATGLKTAEDRMAYAIDHMGTTYAEARDFMARKVFESNTRSSKEVNDQSAFRLISNFVRLKRRVDL